MSIRVLRVLEYEYADIKTALEDMAKWQVQGQGVRRFNDGETIRSSVMLPEVVETEQTLVGRSWPDHPSTCTCMGRGWFAEHGHNETCIDDECVGCVKRLVPCDDWREP